MTRKISLDGTWSFLHAGSEGPVQVRDVVVPAPWQAQFEDLRMRSGIGIYRRQFELAKGWREGRVYLRFGAVFHNTRVWINEKFVGANEGGFLPFGFDVSEAVVEGPNDILVRVESPTDDPAYYPDTPLGEIPFGKQNWYGPLSGIWQSVSVECRPVDHIAEVRLWPRLEDGTLGARVLLAAEPVEASELVARVLDSAGAVVAASRADVPVGLDEVEFAAIAVPQVRPWSPDDPHLYRLEVELKRGDGVVDHVMRNFGFRAFEARNGRFFLNGSPIYLRAALDQDYYPDTICSMPSMEFVDDQLRKAKALGLNCVRLHIKAADPRYLDAADRIGILVWAELPNGGVSTERSRARKGQLLKGMVDRDRHHPSIVIWTIINENWGVDLVHDSGHRTWLKRTYDWLKAYDPSRLVVDNSPLYPSFHVKSDIADYHFYAAIPDSRQAWDEFVARLAARGNFLFGPDNDSEPTGDEPLLCSEFGNWGLPNPKRLVGADGREPWWFETGHDWSGGVMYPHGIENRFRDWHLDLVFGDFDRMVTATQWQQFEALKYQIERMRMRSELAGYVITELTDVHWEANGLLDMRRNPRAFHAAMPAINGGTIAVVVLERWAFWSGEAISVSVCVAHGEGLLLEDAQVTVQIGEAAKQLVAIIPLLEPGQVHKACATLELPEAATPTRLSIETVVQSHGREVCRNRTEVSLLPHRRAPQPNVRVFADDAALAERLSVLGYERAASLEDADVIVASQHDQKLASRVRGGGRLLLMAEAAMTLYPFFPHWQNVAVEMRSGTPWQGDWASTFSWVRRRSPFTDLPGGPLLDLAFDRVIPKHVIVGCNRMDFQARVLAGLFVGWVHKPVALAVEKSYGDGRLVATTFRLLRDPPLADPIATTMLDCLIQRLVMRRERDISRENGVAELHPAFLGSKLRSRSG